MCQRFHGRLQGFRPVPQSERAQRDGVNAAQRWGAETAWRILGSSTYQVTRPFLFCAGVTHEDGRPEGEQLPLPTLSPSYT